MFHTEEYYKNFHNAKYYSNTLKLWGEFHFGPFRRNRPIAHNLPEVRIRKFNQFSQKNSIPYRNLVHEVRHTSYNLQFLLQTLVDVLHNLLNAIKLNLCSSAV
jgi:hypothetical protein